MNLNAFIDAIPNPLIIIDEKKIIQLINHCAELLFGYSKEELFNQSIELLLPEKGRTAFLEYYAHNKMPIKNTREKYCELIGLKKNNSTFPMEVYLGTWDRKGQKPLYLIIFRDLTPYTHPCNPQKEFEQQNQSENQFLSTMHHQLRTPLNAILGFSEILLLKLTGDLTPEQEKQINIINKSGKSLLSLINDLSQLEKIASGNISFFIEEINLTELLKEISNTLRPFAEEKNLQLMSNKTQSKLIIHSDRRLLTQIITNIINNAIKFTEQGTIVLRLQKDSNNIILHVIDTGIGIKKEKMDYLFQAFQQLFISEKKTQGSGLGLHLSKKLADLIGVNLTVTSEYGTGTHFFISIPKSLQGSDCLRT